MLYRRTTAERRMIKSVATSPLPHRFKKPELSSAMLERRGRSTHVRCLRQYCTPVRRSHYRSVSKKVSWRHGRFVRSTNCAPVLLAYWNRSRRLCLYHRNRSILQSFRAVREMREANALGMAVDTMTGIFCKRIAQQCSYAGMRFGGRRSPLKRTICAWSISYPSAGAYIVVILRCVPTKTTAF